MNIEWDDLLRVPQNLVNLAENLASTLSNYVTQSQLVSDMTAYVANALSVQEASTLSKLYRTVDFTIPNLGNVKQVVQGVMISPTITYWDGGTAANFTFATYADGDSGNVTTHASEAAFLNFLGSRTASSKLHIRITTTSAVGRSVTLRFRTV